MNEIHIHLSPESDGGCRVHMTCASRKWTHVASKAESALALRTAQTFMSKFETGKRPVADPVEAVDTGARLRDTFLSPLFSASASPLGENEGNLIFKSTDADYLNLPWELLPGPQRPYLLEDPRWSMRRSTREVLAESTMVPVARPLRILFMACAPTDVPGLDYEKEEEAFLRMANQLGGKVHLDIAEAGTFDELRDLIAEYKPHVVHLSGHGAMRDSAGTFAFENDRGKTDVRDAGEIADHAFAGRGARLVFFSGCQTAQSGASGLCQSLTATGHVPLALGWGASIADSHATEFARGFYHDLAAGLPVNHAISAARRALYDRCRIRHNGVEFLDASFCLPQLYAADDTRVLVDESRPVEKVERPGVQYELLGDNIRGLREGFVGRRRILQRTRPVLRSGEKHILLLTGIGGAGKSTLATRLANRFKQDGYRLAAVRARVDEPGYQFCLRILTEIATACQRLGREGDENALLDGKRHMPNRLRLAVEILNDAPILLVLDNLETAMPLPPERPKWTDPEFAEFMEELCGRLVGKGKAILTCRYVPESFDTEAPNLLHEPLPDFTEGDFIKYLRRHDKVNVRLESGELPLDLIEAFHRKLGATPRFVEQACAILSTIDPDDLEEQLARIESPKSNAKPDDLHELQQRYFADVFLPRLYEALSADEQIALSRFALVEVPLPADGIAAVAGVQKTRLDCMTTRWIELSMLQRFGEADEIALHAVYPIQRSFLTDPTRLDEESAQASHREAALYLRTCYEKDLEQVLRLPVAVELLACLHHASKTNDYECCRWATATLAWPLVQCAEYATALALVEPILKIERHRDLLYIVAFVGFATGDWKTAREVYNEILKVQEELADHAGKAETMLQLANIDMHEGKHEDARTTLLNVINIYQSVGDRGGEAAALRSLASIELRQGDLKSSREGFMKALRIQRAVGDRAGEAYTLHEIASIDMLEGNLQEARQKFEADLEFRRDIRDRSGEATTIQELATIEAFECNYQEAYRGFSDVLQIRRAIGDRAGEAAALHGLASIDLKQGRYRDARARLATVLSVRQEIGDRQGEAAALSQIASVDMCQGDFVNARRGFEDAIKVQCSIGNQAGEATALHNLGLIDIYEENYEDARKRFLAASEVKKEIGDLPGEASSMHGLASVDLCEGKVEEARQIFENVLKIRRKIRDLEGESATLHQIASIDAGKGEFKKAQLGFSRALEIAQDIGDRAGESATLFEIGSFAWNRGQIEAGVRLVMLSTYFGSKIGSADVDKMIRSLATMKLDLGLGKERFQSMTLEVLDSYTCDRGASLVAAAFEGLEDL